MRDSLYAFLFSSSFSLLKASPRPDSFRTNPLWHPRDIREAAKGIIRDDEERDVIHHSRVHWYSALNPTA